MPPSSHLTSKAPASTQSNDIKALTQILSRLEPKILSPNPHSALRYSAYERTKTQANLEYARTLLLRSEHTASGVKAQARKHALQETLVRHRATIKKLSDRLFELGQLDDGRWGSSDDDEQNEDGDGQVDEVLRAVLEDSDDESTAQTAQAIPPRIASLQAKFGKDKVMALAKRRADLLSGKTVESTGLRARGAGRGTSTTSNNTDKTTGTTSSSSAAQPFSPSKKAPATTLETLESAEALHTDLTGSLVSLATQLKLSAQAFSDDLAADESVVKDSETALGRNQDGLGVATKRMGVLRKMSEGRWWWGRMMLYAGIGVLWVVLLLLVFVGPKLRF